MRLPLQPIRDIHFDQRYINNVITPTSKDTYYALFGVALLIIITACINFINLATAQAIKRAKEVGVRKVLGANRSQLVKQFMGETTVLILIALVLGVGLAAIFLSGAGEWINIRIGADQLTQPVVMLWIAGLTVSVILIAGLYPSFVQSAYQPVESLRSQTGGLTRGFTLRKVLVVSQFAISQMLIVGTLIVAAQMDYFQNQDLGFNKDAVISMGLPDSAKVETFRQQLAANPGVKAVSFSSGAPSYANNAAGWVAPEYGVTKDDVTNVIFADENYIDMFGLKMLAGQKLIKTDPKNPAFNLVVNETLIHKMHIMDPAKAIGARFTINGQKVTIMGVVHDFQEESKHKARRSVVIMYAPRNFYMASVRIQPAAMGTTIAGIDKLYSTLQPNDLFDYEFLDEHIAKFYVQEQKVYTAFKFFSGIAIFIGCLGLYGLIMFAAAQRTREIGIRKVLGAPIASIVGLFSKEFVLLISIAFVIAAPLGYYMMNNWLNNYAYHITIGPWTFVLAIIASMIIAGITIAYQAIKAALVNPIKSLRSE